MNRIDCFIPYVDDIQVASTVSELRAQKEVSRIELLDARTFKGTASIRKISELS